MKLCAVEGCDRNVHAKSLCKFHYGQARYAADPKHVYAINRKWVLANPEKVKAIDHEWKNNNREKLRANDNKRRAANLAKYRARSRAWDAAHRDQRAAARRALAKKFPEKECAAVMKRAARKLKATPAWANDFFISEAYHLARLRTKVMGFKWHVDHIVPLRHKLVCGLHVEHNLQVIPAAANLEKKNRWWPDMP